MKLTAKEFDAKNTIHIDRYVEAGSEEHHALDDDPKLTMKWLKMGLKDGGTPAFLFLDSNGRVFGKGENGTYYPFHFENGSQLIGLRISVLAAN